MTTSSKYLMRAVVFVLVICAATLSVAPVFAQERASAQKQEPVQMRQATVQSVKVSPDARADALRSAIEQCGRPCSMGGSKRFAAPGGGGTGDHSCDDNGNCSCFGAKDCVVMSDICDKDTLGCNEHGCICKKASGD